MKHKKSSEINQNKMWIGVIASSIILLIIIGQITKNEKVVPRPVVINTVSSSTSPDISTTTLSIATTSITTATTAPVDASTTPVQPSSPMADFLTKQTMRLAAQKAMEAASTTPDIQKIMTQKKAGQKTYSGQEALNFIKTLPIETQKQILGASK